MSAPADPLAAERSAPDLVDEWVTPQGDRIVVRLASGTVYCDPLVQQLLDAAAPSTIDPAGGPRPIRHYLLDVDGRDHIVLVASRIDASGAATPVSLARCVRIDGTRAAVPSLVVDADARGRGIGTRLLATLAAVARTCGVDRFHLDLSAPSRGAPSILRALRRVGLQPGAVIHGLATAIDVPLLTSAGVGAPMTKPHSPGGLQLDR